MWMEIRSPSAAVSPRGEKLARGTRWGGMSQVCPSRTLRPENGDFVIEAYGPFLALNVRIEKPGYAPLNVNESETPADSHHIVLRQGVGIKGTLKVRWQSNGRKSSVGFRRRKKQPEFMPATRRWRPMPRADSSSSTAFLKQNISSAVRWIRSPKRVVSPQRKITTGPGRIGPPCG